MTIRVVYQEEPPFPATDQHPDAERFQVAGYWVDAIGGEPTEAEVLAVINPSSVTPDPVPSLYAVAQITIADGEISGFDIASKFAGGFVIDTGSYYIFFSETQPDANYLAKAYDGGSVRAFISPENKAEDYFIVSVTDFDGNPVDTASLSLEIIRVN